MDCARAKTTDPEEWLELAPEFSRAMAARLRGWIERWEPDLDPAIKWNNLCFIGRKLIVGISACQRHLSIFFARGCELPDPARLFNQGIENNTSILSIRLTKLDDFNAAAFRALLRAAVMLDADPTAPPPPKIRREPWPVPEFFAAALKKNKKAAANFAALAPTYQREYIVWLTTAKREETRARRLAETLRALAAGRKWIQRKGGAG